jgi:multiple sugar transport system permease protein
MDYATKNRISKIFGKVVLYLFLGLLTIYTLYPLLYVSLGSFKTNQELVAGGINLFPKDFVISNYVEAWKMASFARYTFNSVFLSVAVMIVTMIVTSMAGYCFARRDFKGKELIYGIFIAFMFINIGSISLRPLFELAIKVNLHKSLWGVIIIAIGSGQATYIFLVRGYMATVPKTIDEAAIMDGCGFFQIYWRIILPLLKPVMATIALLSFRSAWNLYVLPMVFTMSSPNLKPLTVGVVSLQNATDGAAAWNLMFAGATMSIVPIVIIYMFTSKHFMSGLTVGAVKG